MAAGRRTSRVSSGVLVVVCAPAGRASNATSRPTSHALRDPPLKCTFSHDGRSGEPPTTRREHSSIPAVWRSVKLAPVAARVFRRAQAHRLHQSPGGWDGALSGNGGAMSPLPALLAATGHARKHPKI